MYNKGSQLTSVSCQMVRTVSFLILSIISSSAFTWETTLCKGEESQRIESFRSLGEITPSYNSENGSLNLSAYSSLSKTILTKGPSDLTSYSVATLDYPKSIFILTFKKALPNIASQNRVISS